MSDVERKRVVPLYDGALSKEWMLEVDSESGWFVQLYTKDLPRRGWKVGDYVVEVFTDNHTSEPRRLMTDIERELFKLALAHWSVEGVYGLVIEND